MKRITYIVKAAVGVFWLLGVHQTYAQQVMINSDGEKIVEYSDGSWRYYQPSDSIYDIKDVIDIPESSIPESNKSEQERIKIENETKAKEELDRAQKAQKELDAIQEQLRLAREERQRLEQAARDRQAKEDAERAALVEQLRIEQERKAQLLQAEKEHLAQEEADRIARHEEKLRWEKLKQEETEEINEEQRRAEENLSKEENRRLKKELKEKEKKEKAELEILHNRLKLEQELRNQLEENERKRQEEALKAKQKQEKEIQKEKERALKKQKKEEEEQLKNQRIMLKAQLELEKELTERAEREDQKKQAEALKEKQRLEDLLRQEQERNQSIPVEINDTDPSKATMSYADKMRAVEELRKKYTLQAKFERDRYGNAQAKKIYVEQELKRAKDNRDVVGNDQIKRLEDQLDIAKSDEKTAKKRSQKATKKASQAIDVSHQNPTEQLSWYEKEVKSNAEAKLEEERALAHEMNKQKNTQDQYTSSGGASIQTKKVGDYKNPITNPPKRKCLADDSIDDFTGKKRRDTRLENFLKHTSDRMRPHLKGESYISCDANLTTTSGYTFINMNLVIANEKANTTFGGLPKNAQVQFTFIDGSSVTLTNRRRDQGQIDQLHKSTTYFIQLIMDKSAEKSLKQKLLDKVKIYWGKGFEEYDVTNLDFFHSQINCLRS